MDEQKDKADKLAAWRDQRKETLLYELEKAYGKNESIPALASRITDILVNLEEQLFNLRGSLIMVIEANRMLAYQLEEMMAKKVPSQQKSNHN